MTRDEVRDLILSFPGVEEGASYGEPSFRLDGKFFTWLRPELGDSLVVHVDNLNERDWLVEMEPGTFHFTDHYRNYPIVLARIAQVDRDWLAARIARRWRKVASKTRQKQHPALPGEPPGA